jgi:hypothetical protein
MDVEAKARPRHLHGSRLRLRGPGGFPRLGVWLSRVLLMLGCLTISAGVAVGQSEKRASPVGVEAIKRVLTSHKQWTLYWDRGNEGRPRLGSATTDRSPSATLEFMRVGLGLVGHAEDDQVHHVECEFEVTVREDGFTFAGCVGSDKRMTDDPDDPEYPFKGRTNGALLWLAPSR